MRETLAGPWPWYVAGPLIGLMVPLLLLIGNRLFGFGTAYAGGCTSGHAIAGLAAFERASLVAVLAFFAGGLITTFIILPVLL